MPTAARREPLPPTRPNPSRVQEGDPLWPYAVLFFLFVGLPWLGLVYTLLSAAH